MSDIAVAISTTGDEHRLDLLAQSIAYWRAALFEINNEPNTNLFVTIDGDEEACLRVFEAVGYEPVEFYQVGQPEPTLSAPFFHDVREGHLGVAVNKNTGIELMMISGAEHLFLSDDDIWPLKPEAIDLHVSRNLKHSMVCWGYHRLIHSGQPWAEWSWPRGSMIYTHDSVVEQVGGMVEEFGPGGHEHVEWSRRIHQAGLTPALYPSPLEYANEGLRTPLTSGGAAMGASDFWYAEDMPKIGEGIAGYGNRKQSTTSVRRVPEDWPRIDRLMAELDGDTRFKPYRAVENGRGSATLYHSSRA